MPTPSEAASLAILVATGACAAKAADVARTLGPEPLRVDPDRTVAVATFSGDTILDVGLPLLGSPPAGTISGCSAQAFWLGEVVRDSILSADPDTLIPRLRGDDRFEFVEILDGFEASFDPDDVGRVLVADRVTFRSPSAAGFVDPAGNLDGSLLLELWFNPRPTTGAVCPAPDPQRQSTFYLMDFETLRPAGSSATGVGALIIGIVAITSLVAAGVGP